MPALLSTTSRHPVGLILCLTLLLGTAAGAQQAGEAPSVPEAGGTLSFGGERQALIPDELDSVEPSYTSRPPNLDGILDEEAWLNAAIIDDFIQQEPAEGDPATERTVVRLMYDDERLYVGVEAYDSIANGVIATEMRRDSLQLLDEDNFQLILDTFNDKRSGYMFVTSPLGAKLEQQIAEEGEGASAAPGRGPQDRARSRSLRNSFSTNYSTPAPRASAV